MTEDAPGQDEPQDSRLTSLEERLRQAERDEAMRTGRDRPPVDKSYQQGNVVLSYLIGGPAGGALVGWVLDRLFGTSPGFLISLLLLGTAAGFWNIIKISTRKPD
jgi:ATP synthase protein I